MADEQVSGNQEEEFEVKLSGPGLQMERKVGQAVALQVVAVLLGTGGMQPVGMPGTPGRGRSTGGFGSPSQSGGGPPKVAVGEYLAGIQVSNNPERIAGIILYLKEHHDIEIVSKSELPEWFKRAGEPVPKNLNRDITNAVKASLISEDPSQSDHYFVTKSGAQRLRSSAA